MITRLLDQGPRLGHGLLIGLALWVHVLIAQEGFMMHLRNRKAAGFAWEVIAAQPDLMLALALPIASIALIYTLYFWLIAILSRPRIAREQSLRTRWTLLLATWFASSWLLLHLHLQFFPRSVWSWWVEPLFAPEAAGLIDVVATGWIAHRVWRVAHSWSRALQPSLRRLDRRAGAAIAAGIIAVPFSGWALQGGLSGIDARGVAADRPPNVLIIGLDSLRRDIALGEMPAEMPNLARFREQAFVQDNVVTPLARTFPSWVSILTGQPPTVSGARDNLVAQEQIARHESLGWKLKALGYRTIYATDETRFSNIGREFGFDEVVSPKPGVPDFLIGQFGDQPLVNFAVQLPLTEHLLPSLVGNRAFAQAYRPERFIARLGSSIGDADDRPTAMAIHLCLAHWPYFSANSGDVTLGDGDFGPYLRAAAELDKQFGDLQAELRRRGYLDERTLVVLLADHGEALSSTDSTATEIVRHGVDHAPSTLSQGHGGSLLVPTQWQVYFMFAGQSIHGRIPSGRSAQLASLADFRDNLLTLLGQTPDANPNRLAVVDAVASGAQMPLTRLRRYVAIETGFRPQGFDVMQPDGEEALRIAASSFDIRADGRVEMKDSIYRAAIETKDFGVTDGQQTLALVQTGHEPLLVAVDAGGRWQIYPATKPANPVPAPPMLEFACDDPELSRRLHGWCTVAP